LSRSPISTSNEFRNAGANALPQSPRGEILAVDDARHYTSGHERSLTPTILIVDDDPNLQRVMSKFLEFEGFAPVRAANGQEALDYLRGGGEPRVILLDLRMPVMDGWAFRKAQRGEPAIAEIPVVVISGVDGEHVNELGAVAAFNKPVSFAEVVDLVRRLCEGPAVR
jgi:CheY-like chemotaxis protein